MRALRAPEGVAADVPPPPAPPDSTAVRQPQPRVERTLADMVRYHDGRRSRYRGQWRVPVQSLRTGLVVKVKRLVTLLRRQGA